MNALRELSKQEKALLVALLQGKPETVHLVPLTNDLVVREMNDGGMGSLALIPKGLEESSRAFGKEVALGEYTDRDGVPVSVAINVDSQGKLYELDMWKVDFGPLLAWPPNPAQIRIVR